MAGGQSENVHFTFTAFGVSDFVEIDCQMWLSREACPAYYAKVKDDNY